MTPPLTKLGSAPSSSRPVTIMPVDVVLPCAPATDDEALAGDEPGERLRAVQHRAARARGRAGTRGCPARARRSRRACRRRRRWRRRGRSRSRRRARAARAMFAESRTSEPVTRCPAPRKRRAMPLMPEPPMPTKCTAPSSAGIWAVRSGLMVTCGVLPRCGLRIGWSAGRSSIGGCRGIRSLNVTRLATVSPAAPPSAASTRATMRSVPSRTPTDAAARGHAADACRGRASSGTSSSRTHAGRKSRVVDEDAAAGVDDVGGVEALLAVADRVRHVDGGDAERGELAHGRRAGARDGEVGDREGEVHAVGVLDHAVVGDAGVGRRRTSRR